MMHSMLMLVLDSIKHDSQILEHIRLAEKRTSEYNQKGYTFVFCSVKSPIVSKQLVGSSDNPRLR